MTRRHFLKAGGVAGAAVAVGQLPWPRARAAEDSALTPPAQAGWISPMRWAQLTLVEDDPGKFDPQFWLDYFKRTRSDAVCLSAGGCVAYYPTKSRSITVAHGWATATYSVNSSPVAANWAWVVIARTDPHATYDDVQAAPPGLDCGGRRGQAAPALGFTRDVGDVWARPLHFEFMTEVKKEIMFALPAGRHLHQRWMAPGCATASIAAKTFGRRRGTSCPARRPARSGAARLHSVAAAKAL